MMDLRWKRLKLKHHLKNDLNNVLIKLDNDISTKTNSKKQKKFMSTVSDGMLEC